MTRETMVHRAMMVGLMIAVQARARPEPIPSNRGCSTVDQKFWRPGHRVPDIQSHAASRDGLIWSVHAV